MEFIKSPTKEDLYVWFQDRRTGEDLLVGYDRKSRSVVCFDPECTSKNQDSLGNSPSNKFCHHVDMVFTEKRLKRRLQSLAKIHIPLDLSQEQKEKYNSANSH